ncbi:MAG: molybdenum cofactor biosynthesis protein B [Alphaproteobacteria bacterium]
MPINENIEFKPINIAVITVSDTRNEATDTSGQTLVELIEKSGHSVINKTIVKDDADKIIDTIKSIIANTEVDAIISTGGTGLTGRDVTPEAIEKLCDKIIPGFGELFRMLSYEKIGTSTIQSRAIAGVYNGVYIFALPGSKGAVKDGWNDILQYQLDIRHTPCNFVEIMPRLNEK